MKIIYAIPGLGTTKELFKNISVPNFQLKVLDWPAPRRGLTLEEYSLEFISQIDTSRPVNLIGVSFGGMLCVEIAEKIDTEKLVLISSCKGKSELPVLFKVLQVIPLYKLLGERAIRRLAKRLYKVLGFDESYKFEFYKMIDAMCEQYFYNCIRYILHWQKKSSARKALHVHGTNDMVLPHRYVRDFIPVKKGSHAMVLDRAQEINALLDREFNGL